MTSGKTTITLITCALLAACKPSAQEETATVPVAAPPPEPATHFLLICIDTVSGENFFSPRIEDALTPWLASAQQYPDATSAAPWTIPSVSTTLTGLYPVQHRAGQFEKPVANLDVDLPSALSGETLTLAEVLGAAGFDTAAFSAHPWFAADFGFDQGFGEMHLRKGWPKVQQRFGEWLDGRPAERRFFGYLHFMEAHDWHAKAKTELDARLASADPGLIEDLRLDASAAACADDTSVICRRNMVYNLAVREMRAAIAALLTDLEARGHLDDTLVVVYSDHGEEFWQHKGEHEERGDPRGFHGYGHGQSLYQELLNVPLLAWHPGSDGAVQTAPVSLVDVFPSALTWLGLPMPDGDYPGRTLPLGPGAQARADAPLFASGIAYGPEAIASRDGPEKSIFYLADQSFEHFDLGADPEEKSPIENDARTMQADVLSGDYLDMGAQSVAHRPELNAEQLEQLKSIGYLQGVEEDSVTTPPEAATSPDDEKEP